MLLNCGVGEDSWESLGLQGDSTNPWVFIGRTDAKAKAPILWPSDAKSWLVGKDPDAGKDWRQEKGTTEDVMVRWYHWLSGHEFEQTLGDGWMASPTQWTWVWVNSRSWWWTGRPGVLQTMGSQRVGHDWATELNWEIFTVLWEMQRRLK